MDNEIDRKIDVTAILFLLVLKSQPTHDWTLIGADANGLGIQDHTDSRICNDKYLLTEDKGAEAGCRGLTVANFKLRGSVGV